MIITKNLTTQTKLTHANKNYREGTLAREKITELKRVNRQEVNKDLDDSHE